MNDIKREAVVIGFVRGKSVSVLAEENALSSSETEGILRSVIAGIVKDIAAAV